MNKLNAKMDYPLYDKHPELIRTSTGRALSEITMEAILNGEIDAGDCRISYETLEYHAQIEEALGNVQMAETLRRSAEMTRIPDERILEIYNAMRPRVSAKAELQAIADELVSEYGAIVNARFIKEAMDVYEKQGLFKED